MRRRLPTSSARRPELLDGLIDASSFAMPPAAAEFAALLASAMDGQPYDVALDRVRRLVNERRFALGVQLIDRRRDPLEVAEGYARVAEGALIALGRCGDAEFEQAHGEFAGGELVVLGLGRLGGRSLTHASDLDLIYLYQRDQGGVSDGAKPLGPNDYFNRLASRVTAALSVPTAAGPLYEVDTRLRPEGAKGMLAVSLEAFARYQRERSLDVGAYGAVPRAAGLRLARRCASECGDDRRHPAHAARSRQGGRATRRGCARRSSVTSRRAGRSTSSSGRAVWSISNSRSTCCS